MEEIADGVYIETDYDGVNVGAVLTAIGVVCIDVPTYPRDARDWVNRVERLHGRGVSYLILTDYQGERVLNARWMNAPIIAHRIVSDRLSSYDRRYPQSVLDNLIQRNPVLGRDLLNVPVEHVSISFDRSVSLHAGDKVINLVGRPGPTSGSIWVSLPVAGILFVGDSVTSGTCPPLGEMCLQAWLDGLGELIDDSRGAGMVVPGRGVPGGLDLVESFRSCLKLVKSVVERHIAVGGTRDELSLRVTEITAHIHSHGLAPGWVEKQVQLGLQRAFDELMAAANVPLVK